MADGIHVSTNDPSVVPKEVEGVPIIIDPPKAGFVQPLSHTTTAPNIRPLHGAVAINDITSGSGSGWGTLTGVVLSDGKPWLVFPSHILNNCNQTSPCPPSLNTPLNQCPHLYIMSSVPQKPYPYWYLDNGSQTYPSCTEDQCYFFQPAGTVASALRPVAFGKSVVKAN